MRIRRFRDDQSSPFSRIKINWRRIALRGFVRSSSSTVIVFGAQRDQRIETLLE